jgi:hypothetical protein
MAGTICIVATCLLANPPAASCARGPGAMEDHRRTLKFEDAADIPAHPLFGVEKRACQRIAKDLERDLPPDRRLVTVETLVPRRASPAPTQKADAH